MKTIFLLFGIVCYVNCNAQPGGWYKLLKGTIDKYPVTVYLYHLHHNYSGYYYYDAREEPIAISGEDSLSKAIVLTAMPDQGHTETFRFLWDGKEAKGTWQQGKKPALSLSLTATSAPVSFLYDGINDSVRLRPKLPDSPVAVFEASSVWPTGSTATDEFIKAQIRKQFSGKQNSKDIRALLLQDGKAFLSDYIETNKEATNTEITESPNMFNYDASDDLQIAYQSDKIICFSFSSSAYTGGAHGNYAVSYLALDLLHNKALQPTDVITPAGIKQLRPLLEKQFRKDRNLQPAGSLTDEGLFDNKIEPNNNFYVTGKGITFSYSPYEIASYATGGIEIFIAFADMQPYLQPAFLSLLK